MSDVQELLDTLAGAGVRLTLDGEQLRFQAPAGAMTPDMLKELRERKGEIISTLRATPTPAKAEPRLISRPLEGTHPLTFLQYSFADLYTPSAARRTHMVTGMRLRGSLRLNLLSRSVRELARRHTILRASIGSDEDGSRWLVIGEDAEVPLYDIAAGSGDWQAAVESFASRMFVLQKGPLYRIGIVRHAENEHVVVFVCHHAVADGWSMPLIWNEILARYDVLARGREKDLNIPPLPVQFTDFTYYQSEWLLSDAAQRARKYWRERLMACESPFLLPYDRTSPVVRGQQAAPVSGALPSADCSALAAFCKREGVVLPTVALAAFVAALALWGGGPDIITWVCHAGRRRREVLGVVGCFFDTWLLRLRVSRAMTLTDLVQAVQAAVLDAIPTLDLPGVYMAGEFTSVRGQDLYRTTLFNFLPGAPRSTGKTLTSEDAARGAVTAEPVEIIPQTRYLDPESRMAVLIMVHGGEDSLRWNIQFDPACFEDSTVEAVSKGLRELLQRIGANPSDLLFGGAELAVSARH